MTLEEVVLDSNPIGELGARAVMTIPAVAGSRVHVSVKYCNISKTDTSSSLLNFDKICRNYELDMKSPMQRGVMLMLLQIVASHHSYIISKCQYQRANLKVRHYNLIITF
jgi:hypothetical protein